jgi:hypothetical protein
MHKYGKLLPKHVGRYLGAIALLSTTVTAAIASTPVGRYAITSATVVDTKTGLTWQRTAAASPYSWPDAKIYCGSAALKTTLGGMGWRLPTVKELQTIFDYTKAVAPFIDTGAFGTMVQDVFWSSSTLANSPGDVWYVNFTDGGSYFFSDSFAANVRCVR